jgi:hypothetical protein
MSAAAPRCRLTSLDLGEPLRATATWAPSWLLVEHPGPWGPKALTGERLPAGLGAALARASETAGVRVNLIRRHASPGGRGTHVFAVHTGPGHPWVAQTVLADPYEVLAIDLAAVARGERPGGMREHEGPLFGVCTHGRHDPCCAENGRPVARALSARFPARTWESTHLGGDRFAANLACFPHGLYFGRVAPDRAVDIAEAYRDGEIRLDHYRGRTCWPAPVQAAEIWVREETGATAVDGVRPVSQDRAGDLTTVRFEVAGAGTWTARVREREDPKARLVKCHATETSCPAAFELVGLARETE